MTEEEKQKVGQGTGKTRGKKEKGQDEGEGAIHEVFTSDCPIHNVTDRYHEIIMNGKISRDGYWYRYGYSAYRYL